MSSSVRQPQLQLVNQTASVSARQPQFQLVDQTASVSARQPQFQLVNQTASVLAGQSDSLSFSSSIRQLHQFHLVFQTPPVLSSSF
ncbi:hypothetical protein AtEden1_Chr3g0197631 [Arabidopsis thaliana]